jgi:hypothetical protein
MIENSFTREQAFAACKDYKYLIGQAYDDVHTVANVVVCPLDPLNKWIFNTFYIDTKDAVESLAFYHGPYYDVMVISDSNLKYSDLRSFLKARDIPFIAAKY